MSAEQFLEQFRWYKMHVQARQHSLPNALLLYLTSSVVPEKQAVSHTLSGLCQEQDMCTFFLFYQKTKCACELLQEICSHLVMCSDTEVVKKFLSHHTISKLWPLVLLHVWQNFADRNEIFLVLSFLLEHCKVCI